MKKLTPEEYAVLIVNSKGNQSPVIQEIMKLDIEESAFLSTEEWTKKTPLSVYLGNYKMKTGISISVRKVEGGWAIIRKS